MMNNNLFTKLTVNEEALVSGGDSAKADAKVNNSTILDQKGISADVTAITDTSASGQGMSQAKVSFTTIAKYSRR